MLSSAWAKYRYDTDESLSLVRHSEDAAAIAAHLWNDWLPASTKAFLSDGSPEVETRALAQWLAGTHDVGKLSPAFAVQVPVLAGRMRDAG
ncbi:MAG: HD domain-containing protein [Rhodococcus sp. (in: high G+C Gram-positive bacteria)]